MISISESNQKGGKYFQELINHVKDYIGHDHSYGVYPNKIKDLLKKYIETSFEKDVAWYL